MFNIISLILNESFIDYMELKNVQRCIINILNLYKNILIYLCNNVKENKNNYNSCNSGIPCKM